MADQLNGALLDRLYQAGMHGDWMNAVVNGGWLYKMVTMERTRGWVNVVVNVSKVNEDSMNETWMKWGPVNWSVTV